MPRSNSRGAPLLTSRGATDWAIALAASLELGVFALAYLDIIGRTATIALGFALGAVLVTAIILRSEVEDDQPGRSNGP
jgi:hypothetical protein